MEECQDCGYSCDSRERLEKHLEVHAVGLRCPRCDFKAPTRAKWLEHINSPRHVQMHTCRETFGCSFVGETEKLLKDHIRAVHRKGKKTYKCSRCDFVAGSGPLLKRHALEHKKDEIMASSTQQFKCSICGYSAESERKLKNHVWKHGGKKNFKCDKCDFVALTEPKMANHRRKHDDDGGGNDDADEPKFDCPTCGKSFRTPDALKGHRRLHSKRSVFVCPLSDKKCTFTTTMAEYLRAHCRNQHPGETVYKCTKCDFFTRETDTLEQHVASLHAAAGFFSCELCDYATDKEKLFENHMKAKHAPAKKSRCVICKAILTSREDLEEHMESHKETTKKSFDCSKCTFKTHRYGDYRTHVSEHLLDESEEVNGNIDLPDDWMEKPTIISFGKSATYPGYGPNDRATASSSAQTSRQNSPGIFDFKKNVAGFAAKRRRGQAGSGGSALALLKTEVTMSPVVLKQEPEQLHDGVNGCAESEDVKPDIRAMEADREARDASREQRLSTEDIKPEVIIPSPETDMKPAVPQPIFEGSADVKPNI